MSTYSFNPVKILKFSDQAKLQIPAWIKSIQNTILDLDFYELVKNVSASVSREEEERIIKSEIQKLKYSFSQTDKPSNKKRECLIRMIYCHMLGYDVPFGHIQALNMTQDEKMINKRTGYLTLSLCLPEKHELLIMAVNSIMKDLKSNNYLEIASALTALCRLVDRETVPGFMPRVVELLKTSTRPLVRKKCVCALHRFYLLDNSMFDQLKDHLCMALCDKDPSVMAASLCMFLDVSRSQQYRSIIKDLIPSFLSILKQVAEGRLPRHYLYHGVPHPWLQISLLKLIENIYINNNNSSNNNNQFIDKKSSDLIAPVIEFTLQQAIKYKNNAGYSIVYEAIKALTIVAPPDSPILDAATKNISVLLSHRYNNQRYLGIKALTSIVKIAPRCVTAHQLEVIECLESRDETLKRKSLDLLYKMTNTKNVVPICAKLIDHLMTDDQLLKKELVSKISDLAEKYSPNDDWYIETMIRMLTVEGELMSPQSAYNLIRLIAGGTGIEDNEHEDARLKQLVATLCWNHINELQLHQRHETEKVANDLLMKVITWILSEYSYFIEGLKLESVVDVLCDQMDRNYSGDVKSWILTGLTKLSSQLGRVLPQVSMIAKKYINARSIQSQKKSLELLELAKLNHTILEEVLPTDAYCEDIDMDLLESQIIKFTKKAVANGSKQYVPKNIRPTVNKNNSQVLVDLPSVMQPAQKKELNFEYPTPPTNLAMQQQKLHPSEPLALVPSNLQQPIQNNAIVTVPVVRNDQIVVSHNPVMIQQEPSEPSVPKPSKVVWTKKGFVGYQSPPQTSQSPSNSQSPQPTSPVQTSTKVQDKQPTVTAQPTVDPAKEKLAKELFGGMSGDDNEETESRANRLNSKSTTTTVTSPTKKISRQSNNDLVNLDIPSMNTLIPGKSTPTTPKTPISQSNSPLLDLDAPSPIVKSAIQPELLELIPKTSILDNDDNNNNNFTPPLNSLTITSPTTKTTTAKLATQITPGSNFNIQNLNLTPLLKNYINNVNNDIKNQQLYSDNNIVVSIIKQFSETQLNLLVFISNNQSTKSLKNLTNRINENDHLKLEYYGDPIVNINSNTLSIEELLPKLTVLEIIKIDLKKVGFGISINSNIEFNIDDQKRSIPTLSIPIEISDFLIANDLGEEQFEKLWSSYTQEREIIIDSSLQQKSLQIIPYFIRGLNLKEININNCDSNTVFLGSSQLKVMNSNLAGGGILLFRLNVNDKIITLKTNDKNLSDVIARHCYKIHNSTMLALKK